MFNLIDENTLEGLKGIADTIKNFNDEDFTAEAADIFVNATKGSLEAAVRENSINSLYSAFERNNYTVEQVAGFIEILNIDFQEFIIEHDFNNPFKEQALTGVCDVLMGLFKEAAIKYTDSLSSAIRFELTHENAKLPTYAHPTDAGADIYCPTDVVVPARARGYKIDSGLKMAIPEGWRVMIYPRSGMSMKTNIRLSNCVGVIDTNYRGPVCVLVDNLGSTPIEIKAGERIAQMVLERNYQFRPIAVERVDADTDRGEGGFGSTDA